jgi:hypothetical protein
MQRTTDRATRVANAILIAVPAIWLLAALIRFLQSSIPPGPLKIIDFFYVQVALSTVLLLSLKLKPTARINVSLVVLSVLITTYTIELALSFFPLLSDQEKYVELVQKTGGRFDRRSVREVVQDLRKQGVDAVPVFYPGHEWKIWSDSGNTGLLPLAGVSKKTTVYCNESGQYVIYRSDDYGFNNPNEIWRAGPIDIAALGDSYAHGACVAPERSILGLLRGKYPGTLNLAIGADGPLLELAKLKEYLPSLKPKVVLWFYFEGNDLENLSVEETSPQLLSYLEPGYRQGLADKQAELDKLLSEYIDRRFAEKDQPYFGQSLLDFVSVQNVKRYIRDPLSMVRSLRSKLYSQLADRTGYFDPSLRTLRTVLDHAKRESAVWGGRLVFVYLPTWNRYNLSRLGMRDFAMFQTYDEVVALVRDLGIPMIDVHKAFARDADPGRTYFVFPGSHYNEIGHQVVFGEVMTYLDAMQLQSVR